MGPLITARQKQVVLDYIEQGKKDATLVTGGGTPDDPALQKGFFVSPTIFDGVPNTASIAREEIFGPVLSVTSFADFDEAIALANDSDFGLHAGVFTNDLRTALRAVKELDFGGVLINEVPTFRADQQPYGGVRDAGNTREGPAYAIEEMTTLRFVSLQA